MDNLEEGLTYEQVKQGIQNNLDEIDKLNKDKHMGDNVRYAFNYDYEGQGQNILNAQFETFNWNDPILSKVRGAIDKVQSKGVQVINTPFKVGNVGNVSFSLLNEKDHTIVTLTTTYLCDTWQDIEEKVYIIKYYKNRGRTEEFYDTLEGRDINLWDMINLNAMLDR